LDPVLQKHQCLGVLPVFVAWTTLDAVSLSPVPLLLRVLAVVSLFRALLPPLLLASLLLSVLLSVFPLSSLPWASLSLLLLLRFTPSAQLFHLHSVKIEDAVEATAECWPSFYCASVSNSYD